MAWYFSFFCFNIGRQYIFPSIFNECRVGRVKPTWFIGVKPTLLQIVHVGVGGIGTLVLTHPSKCLVLRLMPPLHTNRSSCSCVWPLLLVVSKPWGRLWTILSRWTHQVYSTWNLVTSKAWLIIVYNFVIELLYLGHLGDNLIIGFNVMNFLA